MRVFCKFYKECDKYNELRAREKIDYCTIEVDIANKTAREIEYDSKVGLAKRCRSCEVAGTADAAIEALTHKKL